MLPGLEALACPEMAVSMDVMKHVVQVESSRNPYAIGVVGGALARQPQRLDEAVATARMLEQNGYNFSLGLGQVNRYNLAKYGLNSYEKAFETCPNLQAASRILAECHSRSGGDWGKSFSCYYSGNFTTGFRHGYVDKVFNSIKRSQMVAAVGGGVQPIRVIDRQGPRPAAATRQPLPERVTRLNNRISSGQAPVVVAQPDDPARAYVVYPNTNEMVRGSLLNTADNALSRAVMGLVDRAVPPAQAQEPMGQYAEPPQQAAPAVAGPQGQQAPVLLQPWGQRSAPATGNVPAPQQPQVPQGPPVDDAFVF
ncbi:MAG: lytic transglycosylase domain-containing protein [Stenotrophomonas sp.]|nr:lytic transglycosylase domain-containing protein [Stenotrophomonas sp.]